MNNYTELVSICKRIAQEIGTMMEVKDYLQFGWSRITFMTDKFGGSYMGVNFNHNTLEAVFCLCAYEGQKVDGIVALVDRVREEKAKMEAARDLEAVYAHINEEYY